jgi:hypothetical protein
MRRLLILTFLAMLLGGLSGCRFMECLWRGPACQQQQVTCPSPCQTYNPCDPCAGGTTTTMPAIVTPGPGN